MLKRGARGIAVTAAMLALALITRGAAAKGAAPAPRHLYVLDSGNKAVYRFPLAADGLPATRMDSALYLDGASDPQGLAVDRAGHVFVADSVGWGGAVAEFAPGTSGLQKPIALLQLGQAGPDYLRLDEAGRLYVHASANQDILVFAPGAHGNAAPLSVIAPVYQHELAADFAIDKDGTFYLLVIGGTHGAVLSYDDPLVSPSVPSGFMFPRGTEFTFWQTMALDAAADRLYVEFTPRTQYRWNTVNFAVRSLHEPGPVGRPESLIYTGDCGTPAWAGVGGSLIFKSYLILSCAASNDVLVFRNDRFGRQHAVETVVRDIEPWEITLGP